MRISSTTILLLGFATLLIPSLAYAGVWCMLPPNLTWLIGLTLVPMLLFWGIISLVQRKADFVANKSSLRSPQFLAPLVHFAGMAMLVGAHEQFGSLIAACGTTIEREKIRMGLFDYVWPGPSHWVPFSTFLLLLTLIATLGIQEKRKEGRIQYILVAAFLILTISMVQVLWPGCMQTSAFAISGLEAK